MNAICPERAAGGNEISALASVTDVYVSNDLQVCACAVICCRWCALPLPFLRVRSREGMQAYVLVVLNLQVVKVYVSVYSDAMGKKRAMDRLKKLEG